MIRLTRELDRYHGLAQAPALPKPRQRGSHSRRNSTRAEEADAKFSASQPLEIARNREGISETSPPPK